MSRSTKTSKIKYNSIRHSNADYIKHFLKEKASTLAVGVFSFLLGGLFLANIAVTMANAPTLPPPDGNVDGRFGSLTVNTLSSPANTTLQINSDILLNGNFAIGGPGNRTRRIWVEEIDAKKIVDTQTIGPLSLNNRIITGSPFFSRGEHPISQDAMYVNDTPGATIFGAIINIANSHESNRGFSANSELNNLGMASTGSIVSVRRLLSNEVYANNIGNFSLVPNDRVSGLFYQANSNFEVNSFCPENTFITGCSGYVEGSGTSFIGTKIEHPRKCTSIGRKSTSGSGMRVYAHANCFDPKGATQE